MEDVVWESTVDDRTWHVRVVRASNYQGVLEIYRVDDDELVYAENVSLAYQALFGPDMDDVVYWQNKTIEVIDSLEQE